MYELSSNARKPSSRRMSGAFAALLLAGLLVSCGGGGGETASGGSNNPPNNSGNGPGTGGNGPNPGPSSMAGQRFEESNTAVQWSTGWTPGDVRAGWSGGAARQSTLAGATATFTFTGTSVTWIGNRNERSGIALVRVDSGPATEVNLFARSDEVHTQIITLNGLSSGQHTLTIEVTDRKHPEATANAVVVDAFDVEAPVVSQLQETDPDVSFTGTWAQAVDTLPWSGGGVYTDPDPPYGGARVSETAGAKVTLPFRGTSISWSGYRGPNAGIARVQIDGGTAIEVDTYSAAIRIQDIVFTAKGLTDADHTLTIEVTGRKNPASTGAEVFVDSFDVSAPGRRYQEEDAAVTYDGAWNHFNRNRTWSEGSAATTSTIGASVSFAFTGSSVSWISCRKASIGRARVYIDGAFQTEIEGYAPVPIEGYQHTVFRKDGLSSGPHILTIEAIRYDCRRGRIRRPPLTQERYLVNQNMGPVALRAGPCFVELSSLA